MFDFILERLTSLHDMIALFLGLGLLGVLVYWARSTSSGSRGFVIHVDPEDVAFTGQFPPQMQGVVIEFLRNDVRVEEPYQVRGHWQEDGGRPMLIVVVKGDAARMQEQRIRNFLKLNLKPPRN